MSNRIDRQKILSAAVETLRKGEGLNARSVAKTLGCSTQPIYSIFKNMDELKAELRNEAVRVQKEKVDSYFENKNIVKYKAFGMGFVKFAGDESELFRFLYMQNPNTLFNESKDALYEEIIAEMQKAYGFDKKQAESFHTNMSIYTYGLAVLQSLGRKISEEEVSECLTMEFKALYDAYKKLK